MRHSDFTRDPRTVPVAGAFGGVVRVFFGAPSGEGHRRELAALHRAACRIEATHGINVAVVTGDDCPPRCSLAAWIRDTLESEIDGVVAVHGRSWGCGREDAIAANRRLVRAVLVHDGDAPSRTLTADGATPLARVGYADTGELELALVDWFEAYIDDLQVSVARRARRGLHARPWRISTLRRWSMIEPTPQQGVAHALGMTTVAVSRMLQEDGRYAQLPVDDAVWLSNELQRIEAAARSDRLPHLLGRLVPRERLAFDQARRMRRWDDDTAAAVVEHGLALRDEGRQLEAAGAAGEQWKLRLTGRDTWYSVHEDLCQTRGS